MKKGGKHSGGRNLLAVLKDRLFGAHWRPNAGFTIVETLIVLAVTGILFASAVIVISGRQNRTEFETGINNLQQQIQEVISETETGYFPSSTSLSCGGGSGKGTNYGCVFLGKAIEFGVTQNGDDGYNVYPLIGDQSATTVASSNLRTLPDDSTVHIKIPNGLQVVDQTKMNYINTSNGSGQTAAVGFISGDSTGALIYSTSSGLIDGAEQFSLYALKNSTIGTSPATIKSDIGPSSMVLAKQVTVCFQSGTTQQSGLITIGNNVGTSGGGLGVALKIYGNKTCS